MFFVILLFLFCISLDRQRKNVPFSHEHHCFFLSSIFFALQLLCIHTLKKTTKIALNYSAIEKKNRQNGCECDERGSLCISPIHMYVLFCEFACCSSVVELLINVPWLNDPNRMMMMKKITHLLIYCACLWPALNIIFIIIVFHFAVLHCSFFISLFILLRDHYAAFEHSTDWHE